MQLLERHPLNHLLQITIWTQSSSLRMKWPNVAATCHILEFSLAFTFTLSLSLLTFYFALTEQETRTRYIRLTCFVRVFVIVSCDAVVSTTADVIGVIARLLSTAFGCSRRPCLRQFVGGNESVVKLRERRQRIVTWRWIMKRIIQQLVELSRCQTLLTDGWQADTVAYQPIANPPPRDFWIRKLLWKIGLKAGLTGRGLTSVKRLKVNCAE